MRIRLNGRGAAAVSAGVGITLLLTACGADEIEGGGGGGGGGGAGGDEPVEASEIDCAPYEEFGDIEGETVNLYTGIVAPEDQFYIDAFVPFEECTGADVVYEGSQEFEAQLLVRTQAGNPPDIALVPQPGLLQTLVSEGGPVAAPAQVEAAVDEYYGEDWKGYGTVDGTFYAAPNSANVKSFVWYSPSAFEEAGYEVPETWDDMLALSEQIAADNADNEAVKPWCAGLGSGDATGWPATDWIEDTMLRLHGPEVYDQWVNHEIPFDDPRVIEALDTAGEILKNPEYVNGGIGGVETIATTTFQDAGLPILDGNCYMSRQASFYAANWPEGTIVAEDGDVFAFYLPPIEEEFGTPVLGAGEFVVAFNDEPATQAFQLYMTSPEFINLRASYGQFIPPSNALDTENLVNPIDELSAELLNDEDAVFRFDGSDLMPAAVGSGSFWSEMVAWIGEDKPSAEVASSIEASWP